MPRRPTTAMPGTEPSKARARSLSAAASSSAARLVACGSPGFSSSPVSTTITCRPASSPSAASARSASTITTSPPFMSETPLPKARSPSRRNGSPSSTVSRWPISRTRAAGHTSAASPVLGDEMAGAADLVRHLDPARLEAEPGELGGEDRTDLAHPGEILGRARLVDGALKELDGARSGWPRPAPRAAARRRSGCRRPTAKECLLPP